MRIFLALVIALAVILPSGAALAKQASPIHLYFVYMEQKPTEKEVKQMTNHGIEVYLDSWIPPLNYHPYGFLLARVPDDSVKKLLKLKFVIRIVSAEVQISVPVEPPPFLWMAVE